MTPTTFPRVHGHLDVRYLFKCFVHVSIWSVCFLFLFICYGCLSLSLSLSLSPSLHLFPPLLYPLCRGHWSSVRMPEALCIDLACPGLHAWRCHWCGWHSSRKEAGVGGQLGETWPAQGGERLLVRAQRADAEPPWQPEGEARPAAPALWPWKPPPGLCSAGLGDMP